MLVQEVSAVLVLEFVDLEAELQMRERALHLGFDRDLAAFQVVDVLPCRKCRTHRRTNNDERLLLLDLRPGACLLYTSPSP